MVKNVKWTLAVSCNGSSVTIASSIDSAMGARTESTRFVPGRAFQGSQRLGGQYNGFARLRVGEGAPPQSQAVLVIEKRFNAGPSRSGLAIREQYTRGTTGELLLTIACDNPPGGAGPVEFTSTFERADPAPTQSDASATDGLAEGPGEDLAEPGPESVASSSSAPSHCEVCGGRGRQGLLGPQGLGLWNSECPDCNGRGRKPHVVGD